MLLWHMWQLKYFPQWVHVSDLKNKDNLIPCLKSWYIISNVFKASFSNLHQRSFIFRSHLTLVMKLHTPPRYSLFKVAQQHQQNNIRTNYTLLTIWDINTSSSGPSVMFMETLVLSCVSTEGKNSWAWLLGSLEIQIKITSFLGLLVILSSQGIMGTHSQWKSWMRSIETNGWILHWPR